MIETPSVILLDGNAGASTVYAQNTSAKTSFSGPPFYYPTSANIPTGSFVSGTMSSLQSVDADRYIARSTSGGSLNSTLVTTTGAASATMPETMRKIFRNPRGQQSYYVFYRDTVSSTDKCWYAYSNTGTSWTADQDTGLSADFARCSFVFREDATNSRTLVYLTAAKDLSTVGTGRDIVFRIGSINDTVTSISWLTSVQVVRASNSTENHGNPSIDIASDGFLHVAFGWVNNPTGSIDDRQNVGLCSSQTTNPTTNPTWTCTNPSGSSLFAVFSDNNISPVRRAPLVVSSLSGRDILVIENTEVTVGTTQRSKWVDWNGSSHTFQGTAATFARSWSTLLLAEEASATVNATSGRVHLVWNDADTSIVSRYLDSPYDTWGGSTSVFTGATDGSSITISVGGSVKRLFVFYSKGTNGDLYSKNATDSQSWGTETLEYSNTTTAFVNWVVSPRVVNSSTFSSIPLAWIHNSTTRELWFRTRGFDSIKVVTEFTWTGITSQQASRLNFTLVSQYSSSSVSVTVRLWNFTSSSYVTSGAGYLTYTSSASPSTDESSTLIVSSGFNDFVSGGQAKMNVTGIVSSTLQFDQRTNLDRLTYRAKYDYVLRVRNNSASQSWNVRLAQFSSSSLSRLNNLTAYFHDGTSSAQIKVISGSFSLSTGPFYSLGTSTTIFIATEIETTTTGTSIIDTYLEVFFPGSTAYSRYIIRIEIT